MPLGLNTWGGEDEGAWHMSNFMDIMASLRHENVMGDMEIQTV